MNNITDKQAHYLQNLCDLAIDGIKEKKFKVVIDYLIEIRDNIPCSCGKEDDNDSDIV